LIKKTLNIIENTIEIIHCKILSNPSLISNIEWFKNDQLILEEYQEELRINFTNIENLSCRAKNTVGQAHTRINVNILYKSKLSMTENITLNQETFSQSCRQQQHIAEYIIENIDRSHAGIYICEVKNLLNISLDKQYDGISNISTDVRIQYAPFILNSFNKLAVKENSDITIECFVDSYPKADIIWFGPFGQRLNSFTNEKVYNSTVISSELHLPASNSSILGVYRCVAKNNYGQHDDFSIQFQRPGLPDPPIQLEAINITHTSFIIKWKVGYNGGSDQIYHIILSNNINNHTEEKSTNLNLIKFKDLNEKTRYMIKIRSKNHIGFSDYSTNLFITTKESPIRLEEFPNIEQAYYTTHDYRLHFQISSVRSILISLDQLCIQYYNNDDISACIPLTSIQLINDGITINIEQKNLRLKLCLINQTDICSKSIPILAHIQLSNHPSDFILMLIGGILGFCIVFGLIILSIYIHQRKYKKKSKNGSTDTLKTNSDNFHPIVPVRVRDTNPCLYYPRNESRTLYYNDETIGIYSIQEKKNSICFDSGMPSITSNNSDSIGSQALSSLDFYDRSDGEYLVNGRRSINKILLSNISTYTTKDNHMNISINGRISSEEESDISTLSKSQNGKKLVYEVVVNSDQFIPHPILDDSKKTMRIIANPVYDKLTFSRAAQIQKHHSDKYCCKSAQLTRPKKNTIPTSNKSLNSEETLITPLPTKNNTMRLKSTLARQKSSPLQHPISSSSNELSSINIESSLIKDDKKFTNDNCIIRYKISQHGFEIQRYSSNNWLSIDMLSKDACQSNERTFREMIEKKEHDELISHSIYTSEYYYKRWYNLLKSYKQNNLTHLQWAKQNYQLYCLKTYYKRAFQREQYRIQLNAQNQRRKCAQNAFNEWKESKNDDSLERSRSRLTTANSQNTTEIISDISNRSLSSHHHTNNQMSISPSTYNEQEELSHYQPIHSSKSTKNTLYMLDKQRWSLDAMLKRIVGLAEPLPPPPKIINFHNSSLINQSTDSNFESCP
ncbi:unnamed protein product, partial [Rotaria sp. Silwood1]